MEKCPRLRGLFKASLVKFNFSKIIDFGVVLDPVIETGRSPFCLVLRQIGRGKKYPVPDRVSMAKGGYRVARPRKSMCLDRLSWFRWKTIISTVKIVQLISRGESSILTELSQFPYCVLYVGDRSGRTTKVSSAFVALSYN